MGNVGIHPEAQDDYVEANDIIDFVLASRGQVGWAVKPSESGEREHDWCFSSMMTPSGLSVCRLEYILKTDVAARDIFVRPELLNMLDQLQERFPFTIERQLAPGVVDAFLDFSAMCAKRPLSRLLHAMAEKGAPTSHEPIRFIVRHDFPEVGEQMVVVTGRPGVSDLNTRALVTVFSPHRAPGSCRVTRMLFLRRRFFPTWAWRFGDTWKNHDMKFLSGQIMMSPLMMSLRQRDRSYYSVLMIKRCLAGPPLLPCSSRSKDRVAIDDDDFPFWVQGNQQDFSFPVYLRSFLPLTACPHVDVYDQVDGKKLVPYQAVVPRHQWQLASEAFDAAMRIQRKAYRKRGNCHRVPQVDASGEDTAKYTHDPTQFVIHNFVNSVGSPAIRPPYYAERNGFVEQLEGFVSLKKSNSEKSM